MLSFVGAGRRSRGSRRALLSQAVESLEPRVLLSAYVVTNVNDSGAGSLRDAITQANANPGSDEIDFAIGSGSGVQTITLASPLPVITDPLYVNGTSQPNYSNSPLIQISGYGISISAGGSTLRGLCLNSTNKGPLITLANAGGNTIQGCYVGTDPTGAMASGNGEFGIYDNDTPNNQIGGTQPGQGNLISGNTGSTSSSGIFIFGLDASHNTIQGNRIGTDVTGSQAIPNTYGIDLNYGCLNTQVGGTTAGAGNLISGNQIDDVVTANQSHNATIQGNLIGVNAAGTASLSNNNFAGVEVEDSPVNTIGGTTAAARNVVSGHQHGIYLNVAHAKLNVVQGNYVGTDVTGLLPIPNSSDGVTLDATSNTLGGTTAGARNVIAASNVGVVVGAASNVVQGNYVGLNAAGAPLGNTGNGVLVAGSGSTIGGTAAGAGNVISANGNGIVLTAGTTVVQGNLIGTDPTGATAIPNANDGILINNAADTIGGTAAGARNLISGNAGWGVEITGAATGNVLQGNYVGTNLAGTAAVANALGGVLVSAPGTTVGGAASGARNLISGNPVGVSMGADGATLQGNYVGTDVSGANPLPNFGAGVTVSGSSTTIGGTAAGAGNVISANGGDGIDLTGGTGALVQGNVIGANAAGTAPLGNAQLGVNVTTPSATLDNNVISANHAGGVALASSGALLTSNRIGTSASGAAASGLGNGGDGIAVTGANNVIGDGSGQTHNVIAQNVNGISVTGAAASGAVIQANYVGTTLSGASAAANSANGILVTGAASILIGGVASGTGNVVSGNAGDGILFAASTPAGPTQELVQGNYIGTNSTGAAALPNQQNGIEIRTPDVLVGGTASGARNVISGNAIVGVICGASGIQVQGNYVGADATGAKPIPNVNGIVVGGNNVTIGGTSAAARNVISGNANGIVVGANASGLLVQGNYVGTNASGSAALPNSTGIKATGGGPVTIGGTAAGAGNLISGNGGIGIWLLLTSGQSGLFTIQGNHVGTDASGAAPLPNVHGGISLQGAVGTLVGGQTPGAANVIAFNGGDGIDVTGATATGNTISANAIYSNVGLGIDLGADGVTPNDPGDADTGPNNLQNFPVLTSALSTPTATTIAGTLGSAPSSSYVLEFFAVPPGGPVFLGSAHVTTDATGSAAFSLTLATGSTAGQTILATATDAAGNTSEFSAPIASIETAVVARQIFYNDSFFDGNDPAANAADDNAIATDKQALLPSQTATFANYTSYSRGINGIMVDVSNLPGVPTASDFAFKVGNTNAPASWTAAPAPSAVLVRPGAGVGGSTRIEITWPDNSIQNEWLQVTVASTAQTGLAGPDVFYFGNAIGESGNSATDAIVDSSDELAARNDPHSFLNPASITDPCDYNRDGKVDAADQLIARNNATAAGAAVQLISVPAASATLAASAPSSLVMETTLRPRKRLTVPR